MALLCTYLALKNGIQKACQDLQDYFGTTSYKLLFAGLLVVLVVSRVLGMRLLVHIISGPYFHQSIKSFLEEGTELLGYMIIFSSSLCYCLVPEFSFLQALLKPEENTKLDRKNAALKTDV